MLRAPWGMTVPGADRCEVSMAGWFGKRSGWVWRVGAGVAVAGLLAVGKIGRAHV